MDGECGCKNVSLFQPEGTATSISPHSLSPSPLKVSIFMEHCVVAVM